MLNTCRIRHRRYNAARITGGTGMAKKRIIIGISGASGAIYGVRMLQALQSVPDVETHLVMSNMAHVTLATETSFSVSDVHALADHVHHAKDLAAAISSGSFKTIGM